MEDYDNDDECPRWWRECVGNILKDRGNLWIG